MTNVMKLPDGVKRALAALRGTANLVALTIIAWAAFLTWDGMLAIAGLVAEAAFLVCAACAPSYRKKLAARVSARPKWIDLWLLIVTVSGFVIILFFGFGKMLLTPRLVSLSHAQGWEVGAIGWTALFLSYYLFKFQKTKNPQFTQVVYIFVALVSVPLLYGLWLTKDNPVWHVALVLVLAIFLLVIDLFLLFQLVTPKHKDEPNEINRSLASLFGGDIPMVVTFSLLLLYLVIYYDADRRDVFVSGVIACQLLFSNAVFVVTEFGWLQPSFVGPKENHDNRVHEQVLNPPTQQLVPPVTAE